MKGVRKYSTSLKVIPVLVGAIIISYFAKFFSYRRHCSFPKKTSAVIKLMTDSTTAIITMFIQSVVKMSGQDKFYADIKADIRKYK